MSSREWKIGIMGGTFDPIHTGHLILGECAWEQFNLDRVLFMPSGNPPHKTSREGRATQEQRVEMVRRAVSGNPHFELSCEEIDTEGYNYTSRTLLRLTALHPGTSYFFIMGADSLVNFDTWKDPQIICEHCTILAAVRDHMQEQAFKSEIARVSEEYHADIRPLLVPNIDISSSMIRRWRAEGKSCRYYLPDSVIEYIAEQNLYGQTVPYQA